MQTIWLDVRYGFRILAKHKGFTAIAVLTLAFGIGANTAIFSLLNAVMLQSIPVRNPQQLVILQWAASARPKSSGSSSYGDCLWSRWTDKFAGSCSLPSPVFENIRDHNDALSSVGAFAGPAALDLSGNGTASIVRGELVSGDYFRTLGVQSATGRVLELQDDKPGAPAVAVLSYAYWQGAFGGANTAVGKSIQLNGVPFTIVGVAEQGFTRLTPGKTQELWLTLSQANPLGIRWGRGPDPSKSWWLTVIGRLKPGVSSAQAQTSVSLLFQNQVLEEKQFEAKDEPHITLVPAQKALTGFRGQLGQPLTILMMAVGIVLLVACANVAGLMLARATSREKEMAVRLAMGAGRGRIIRQLLTESILLSSVGTAIGVWLAYWGATSLAQFVAANRYSTDQLAVNPDWRVFGFTTAIAVTTGILFGLAPALRATRVNLAPVLKENAGSIASATFGSRRKFGLGNALVIAQVALSVIVLAGAGLVVRSLSKLQNINPGFDTRNVLQFAVDPKLTGYYKDEQIPMLYRELASHLSALPGVSSVSYSSDTLLDGSLWSSTVKVEGRTAKEDADSQMLSVGPDFFATMKIPVLMGRGMTRADMEGHDVAVVNQEFVKRFLENREPVGLHFGGTDPKDPQYEIIGVVGDTKYAGLRDAVGPTAFVPIKAGGAHFALKTAISPTALVPSVRKVVSDLDNNLPISDIRTQTDRINRLLFNERLLARLASLFGLLALVLACVGIYGLLSYEVARRTREIGIRGALGASRRDILELVGSQGLVLVVTGGLLGMGTALGVNRYLETLLFGVKPADPLTFLGVILLLTLVGILACYVPARRATRVDPMVALRYE